MTYLHFRVKVFLCLSLFTLASLACGVQSTLPTHSITEASTDVNSTAQATAQIEMAHVVGSWNLRETPGESSLLVDTLTDVEVQLIDCVSASGGVWCKVSFSGVTGWVNKRGLK